MTAARLLLQIQDVRSMVTSAGITYISSSADPPVCGHQEVYDRQACMNVRYITFVYKTRFPLWKIKVLTDTLEGAEMTFNKEIWIESFNFTCQTAYFLLKVRFWQ